MKALNSSRPLRRPNHLWLAVTQRYPRGVELFRQGQLLEEVFYIDSGFVKLTRTTPEGREMILDLAFAETWLGAAAVLADRPSPVTAVTCADADVRRSHVSVFRQRIHEDPQLSLEIHNAHALECCRHAEWIAQLGSSNSRQRLLCVFRELTAAFGLAHSHRSIKFHLPLHLWEVASLIAVTPEHLSRLLHDLEADGLLRRDKGWIIISDPERLDIASSVM